MDFGELPTGIESPLIPVLFWAVFGLVTVVGLVVTLIAARRGAHRRAVLLIAGGLLVVGVGAGLGLWFRYDLAGLVDPAACPVVQDGVWYMGFFEPLGDTDVLDPFERCLDLQYRFAVLALGGYALAAGAGGLAQLRLSLR